MLSSTALVVFPILATAKYLQQSGRDGGTVTGAATTPQRTLPSSRAKPGARCVSNDGAGLGANAMIAVQ